MVDYKQIDLDSDMPDLKKMLKKHDLLRYKYYITIRDNNGLNVKYYEIEDEEVEKQYSETAEDISRCMQNADINIEGKYSKLHYDCEGSESWEISSSKIERDCSDTFNSWLEKRIIEVVNERNKYWLD